MSLCSVCGKNQATKVYERVKNGKSEKMYCCLECDRITVRDSLVEAERLRSVCPYCNTTVEQFEKSKLVGCAHCYQTLGYAVLPYVTKMQGGMQAHEGKRAYDTLRERITQRIIELENLAKKSYIENDNQAAADYETQIERLRTAKKEGAIWHNPLLSKR